MVEASVIVSIVVAVLSLVGTVAVAVIQYLKDKRKDDKDLKALTNKYAQPLVAAAYDLHLRLYALLEYPVSKESLSTPEGLDDIKILTCYLIARFLAWTYLLETKTQFFSFSTDKNLRKIRDRVLRLYEEFDRRRNQDGQNIGIWPGPRLLVAARMLKSAANEKDIPLDTTVKNYDEFCDEWPERFMVPMSYFCQWIDDLIQARMDRAEHQDDAARCTQHNVVAMIKDLDPHNLDQYFLALSAKPWFCDCGDCLSPTLNVQDLYKYRSESRHNDEGLRPAHVRKNWNEEYDTSISLQALKDLTHKKRYDQAAHRSFRKG